MDGFEEHEAEGEVFALNELASVPVSLYAYCRYRVIPLFACVATVVKLPELMPV